MAVHTQQGCEKYDADHQWVEVGLGTNMDEAEVAKYPYQRAYLPTVRRADGSVHDW